MKRTIQTLLFLGAASLPLAASQQTLPPPPPPAGQGAMAPAPPTQYSNRGTIEQLNYNRAGAVDGFLMNNGTLVFTPPMDQTVAAPALRKGSSVNVQGMAHQTINGHTVVDAQSLKVGDQTIVFAAAGPGPRPPRRGPEGAVPPPPPPPQ